MQNKIIVRFSKVAILAHSLKCKVFLKNNQKAVIWLNNAINSPAKAMLSHGKVIAFTLSKLCFYVMKAMLLE